MKIDDLSRKTRTFLRIAERSPSLAWELLQIRVERKLGVPLYLLSASRLMTYAFEVLQTRATTADLEAYGNYYLAPAILPPAPIVFSLGIGLDTSFDEAVLDRCEGARLFMCDPTPASKRYVESRRFPARVQFFDVAIANHDGVVPVYSDDLSDDLNQTTSVSMLKRSTSEPCATVQCRRLRSVMDRVGVHKVDVLKIDIEGAAIDVLEDVLKDGVYPTQVACELERPPRLRDVPGYLRRVATLFTALRNHGYTLYRTRPTDKGCQIEVLGVRAS